VRGSLFAEMLRGVGLYDADENRESFDTRATRSDLPNDATRDRCLDLGVLKADIATADIIAHCIWDE
jgi:hypothetical protein